MGNSSLPDSEATTKIRRMLAFVAVLLVIVGQLRLYTSSINDQVIIPSPFWYILAGVVLFVLSRVVRPPRFLQKLLGRIPPSETFAWIVAAFTLSVLALISMEWFQKSQRTNYTPVVAFWLSGAVCFVMAFRPKSFARETWRVRLKQHWKELAVVGGITLLGMFLRFYKLGAIPDALSNDEGWMGLAIRDSTTGTLANPFAIWEGFGAFYLHISNVMFRIFGATSLGVRAAPAIGGTLAIPACYLLARRLAGKPVAALAASLLAFSHTHLHFSRVAAVGYIQATWLVPLELYLLVSGLEKRSSWRTALGGVLLGIHFSIYITAQVIVALILVYMLILFVLFRKRFRESFSQAVVFWAGFAIAILPEAVFAAQHPNEFFARINIDGTFQSGWLDRAMALTGHSAVQILGERVIHAFFTVIYYPSVDFYGTNVPILSLVAAAFFLTGLGIILWRVRDHRFLLLNGYFWSLTLAVGIMVIPQSADSYRMLSTLPVVMIIAAIGMDQVFEAFGLIWRQARARYILVAGMVLTSLLVFNVWAYFFHFNTRCTYGDTKGRFASFMGTYLSTLERESPVYLLSDGDYFYGSHLTTDFLSHKQTITNVPEALDSLSYRPGDVIIASPNRVTELRDWMSSHPGGEAYYQYDCQTLMFVAYYFPWNP